MSIQSTGLLDHEALPGALMADKVYDLATFAVFAGVSLATLRRLIRAGDGPQITEWSQRRGGVRGRHGSAWLDSRAKAVA